MIKNYLFTKICVWGFLCCFVAGVAVGVIIGSDGPLWNTFLTMAAVFILLIIPSLILDIYLKSKNKPRPTPQRHVYRNPPQTVPRQPVSPPSVQNTVMGPQIVSVDRSQAHNVNEGRSVLPICEACGYENKNKHRFCKVCGADLSI